ncbi:hypothetical protein KM043_007806 [Ampulex compressa]|nr:hypothetical protein KM043_007806 [Ampulex compressa]
MKSQNPTEVDSQDRPTIPSTSASATRRISVGGKTTEGAARGRFGAPNVDEPRRGEALPRRCLTVAAARSMACIMVDSRRYTSPRRERRGARDTAKLGQGEEEEAGGRGGPSSTTSREDIY